MIILGQSSFMDFEFLRQNVIRIPEVIDIIRQAQSYWDGLLGVKSLVLSNCFYRSDDFFQIHPEFKNLLNDLVQFALYNRLKNQNKISTEYVLSDVNNTRVHLLVLNLQSLKEFVLKHPAIRSFNKEPKSFRSLHAIHSVPKFTLFRPTDCGIKSVKSSFEVADLLQEIESLDNEMMSLNIGIGQKFNYSKTMVYDSILLDEMLEPVFSYKAQQSQLNPNQEIQLA